jgi:sugar-phosphatase
VERAVVERVIALVRERGELKPGVEQALSLVQSRGLRTALASSSPSAIIDTVLDRFGLRSAFEIVHSAEGEPYGKPHPGVYLHTAERLGVRPQECLAIEDSPNGVLAAKAAGMRCLAVPEPPLRGHPWFAIADAVVESLAEIGEVV